ncbi:MAG TPA: hypothetical protein VGV59_05365 [Pyrinomonadaceae bacterium]|nr:hypothetical protein [Pyrinomonadaceae bacterium]
MSTNDCLRKLYVKFRYIPPLKPEVPADCKVVKISKNPEIRTFTGQLSKLEGARSDEIIGLDLVCLVPSTEGAGAIILLAQVSSYIEWEFEFTNIQGKAVRETHRVFVSLPMMQKISGPRIALMAIIPLKMKLPVYAAQIWNAFKKLSELEKPLAIILALKKGLCPQDIKALESGLQKAADELNGLLRQAASSVEGELARTLDHQRGDVGRFVGTRIA